ncbi:hypothetical protein GCM10009754_80470 [Amycolatopsis minnesotensis]|uniref:DDE superfamily endonuclease n=1 Tax=Amycolatopsis minnesotensis TaxID=337894 RepID=A0ABP5E363_9PSEU
MLVSVDESRARQCRERGPLPGSGEPRRDRYVLGITSSAQGDKPAEGVPHKAGTRCTDQVDYAGDPRPNVEINSEGEDTGVCPAPKHS